MSDLQTYINQFPDKTIAVAVYDLETGKEILINADESFHPCSTIKVHVMIEVFRQAEAGYLSLDDHLPLINSFTSIADASKFALEVNDDGETTLYQRLGESESIAELTRLMIIRSSNLAHNILIEKVGMKDINAFIQSLGIEGVVVRRGVEDKVAYRRGLNNSATARGLTKTMQLIAEGKVVSKQASEKMIEIMLQQEFNESIPALLPNSARVAHKTGWQGE
ncbi:MAG TPA: serine hydrolase, partial [Anaerolineales bacterium]|nr:serine hydrolase [Anaerolineales bacterium]